MPWSRHVVVAPEELAITTATRLVTTGLVGDSFTEVTSGLKEGDVVMLAAPRPRNGGFGP